MIWSIQVQHVGALVLYNTKQVSKRTKCKYPTQVLDLREERQTSGAFSLLVLLLSSIWSKKKKKNWCRVSMKQQSERKKLKNGEKINPTPADNSSMQQ